MDRIRTCSECGKNVKCRVVNSTYRGVLKLCLKTCYPNYIKNQNNDHDKRGINS